MQIANAYLYLEHNNIVHRDVKSHNILLKDNYHVLVCDFGLAKKKDTLMSGSNLYAGTVAYMAPEILNKKNYNEKVDIFAFGTLLWEILTRRIPFEGYDALQIKGFIIEGRELPLNQYYDKTKIPADLMNLVNLCRSLKPEDRPSFNSIAKTLNQIKEL